MSFCLIGAMALLSLSPLSALLLCIIIINESVAYAVGGNRNGVTLRCSNVSTLYPHGFAKMPYYTSDQSVGI